MNFLDTYDIAGTVTPPPRTEPEQSLNEEVSQVIGQLGRFWGGFRKQSQAALETARKDLGDVVVQAQRELSKLTQEPSNAPAGPSAAATDVDVDTPSTQSSRDAETPETVDLSQEASTSASTSSTLFSRLQGVLPPNIVASVQNSLPESLKHATENIDIAHLRTTLMSELQRAQGVTRAQAEEYMHKSEALLREAVTEAGEILRDAVKVIPPEEAGAGSGGQLVWDGTDMWMLPMDPADGTGHGKLVSGSSSRRASGETQRAVATRAEALLRRLKHDPAIIRYDPEADPVVKDLYTKWLSSNVDNKADGIEDADWQTKISANLETLGDREALKTTRDTLVPSEMTGSVFWSRFFFRVYQIEQEKVKRKALIQTPVESEDDFTWEDDDEEESEVTSETSSKPTATVATPSQGDISRTPAIVSCQSTGDDASGSRDTLLQVKKSPDASSQTHSSAATSPRESSESSFDEISSDVVSASGNTKTQNQGVDAGHDDEGDEDEDGEEDNGEDDDEDEDSDWE